MRAALRRLIVPRLLDIRTSVFCSFVSLAFSLSQSFGVAKSELKGLVAAMMRDVVLFAELRQFDNLLRCFRFDSLSLSLSVLLIL